MKTKVLLLVSFAMFIGSKMFAQTTGGPDAYGYVWASSTNTTTAATPVYNWKNIKGTGTQITGLADDNQMGPFNINWNFHSYWNDYGKFWIGSNGYISFQNLGNIAAPFAALPWANSKNTLDPMLCDLTFVDKNTVAVPGATAWYWTNNTDTLIVQYDSIPYWTAGNTSQYDGRFTFEIILSGVDSSITYQYKVAQAGTAVYSMTGTNAEGLETGIENSTGSIGLESRKDAFPTALTSVKYYYPHPVTYQVADVTPAWNQNIDNGGFFVTGPCGKPVHLTTDIANAGNQNVTAVGASGQIFDASLNSVWSSSVTVTSLSTHKDSVKTYPATYAATTPGDFLYRSMTNSCTPSDINSGNDINDIEMVVVDTAQASVGLSFCTATSTTTVFSFGINEGGGVYFIPPFYPAVVTSIDYFIAGTTGTAGFTAKLFKDDGANGAPGTMLSSVVVPNTSVVNTAYNNVPLSTTYTITSGGVYAAWVAGGDSIQLGTDQGIPFSNRNFEYIGGQWATYRNNSAEDMMIRLNIQGNNTAPVITATAAPETCGGSNGTGSVTVTGGTPPYTYLWSSGQSTSAVTGLAAGVYTITISHAGCSRLATDTVKGPTALAVSTAPGAGSATATPSGGMPTYSYSWNTTPAQTTPTATGLAAGTYTVCVTDVNSCTACNTVTVTNGASVNEMYNGASISISPNPFNSITHVKIDLVNPAHGHLMFMVYDMFGREIQAVDMSTYSTSGGTIDFTLNRESIATGMYFYQLKDNSHVLSTGKLIAQ